ncbi:Cof-type HAD-IIB family hydrolase [Tenggerimyces flavus]|uniref:Cof-type HAD-IIB family hydrolase n=1 Tax=Tenggerimyces flavus TaxID=1708749 RepID=A0ABV7YFV1_9ACTN|nr:Cof-type HAD-IIB family hydrolase [Tenggerimyces flavus]MBM7784562.1 Cof subfamily protein (haloacid dehalogenase superfamily) [Tenggerimyces flavus]
MTDRPKLVVSDLDGTLLRTDGTVSDRTRRALARVEEAGSTVIFATGRPTRWMHAVAEQSCHKGIAICSNGAIVYDLHTEEILERHPLAREAGIAVIEAIRAAIPGVSFGVEHGDQFAHEAAYVLHFPIDDKRVDTYVATVDRMWEKPAYKLLVRHVDYDPDTLLAKARDVAGELAELTHSSRSGLLEVSARGVSKASTLALWCSERGIAQEEVVAFGDMPNDLPLLAWAGTAYAVANAHPEVRAAVSRTCPSNNEDGVAQTLEQLFA